MKKILLSFAMLAGILSVKAQAPEDVLRYSYFPQRGTARNMAIGGAMGSLGGDLNALYVNPAGLALYKTSEIVLSPGFIFNNNKANFRGTSATANNSKFDLGTTGLVTGFNSPYSRWTNQAFSIGITQTANFNNRVYYKGSNNQSSYAQQFADEFQRVNRDEGLDIDQTYRDPRFAFGTGQALATYLVDTFRNANGGYDIKALPEFLLEKRIALTQEKTIETSGGIYDIALGYAVNSDDKFYLGGSIGIPIVNYTRNTRYTESDPTNDTQNGFGYFTHNELLTTKGFGINAKLGMIFKPAEYVRLGLAVHTPTYYSLSDRQSSDMTTNKESGSNPVIKVTSEELLQGQQGKTQYTATTPWKAVFSGSYVIREINDTRRQRGFITADIEYVGYPGSAFRADGNNTTSADQQYYADMKEVIKGMYKSAFNFRLGGELKFNTIMFRLGGAYYSNPYKDQNLKSNIVQGSGGIGYRNHGIFVDLTYVHNFMKDVNFPYRLVGGSNTYAEQRNTRGNVVMTVGFKL